MTESISSNSTPPAFSVVTENTNGTDTTLRPEREDWEPMSFIR